MTTTTNYTQDTYRLLAAFHSAAMLKRTPGTLTPDGHRRFFSLDQLVLENRIAAGTDLCELARTARSMARKGLLAHRRLSTRDFWMLTPDGAHVLRIELRDRELTDLAAAALAVEQAGYDAMTARHAAETAQILLEVAIAEHGGQLPAEDELLFAMTNGKASQ